MYSLIRSGLNFFFSFAPLSPVVGAVEVLSAIEDVSDIEKISELML